ncbi:LytTR family DNA-binding domain-containing protein [uncultured Arcticibacterium sp.]|uniref:LytR/AlgR family response regulator transcription factor n=1 Tax=uncultured Arcticibacterium sp. TaxID=2173042 RepID=UPI0030FBB9DB
MSKLLQIKNYHPEQIDTQRMFTLEGATLSSLGDMELRVAGSKKIINLNDVIYLQSAKNYTVFKLKDGKNVISSKTLRIFEEELEDVVNFVRPHRSFMVNFDHVKDLRFNCRGGEIYLKDEVIEISRRKAADFRKSYRKFLTANGQNVGSTIRMKTRMKTA